MGINRTTTGTSSKPSRNIRRVLKLGISASTRLLVISIIVGLLFVAFVLYACLGY